ncbi:MAG: 2-oxoglutarate oxidoreductase [Desulfobacterales bacterium]|nr:2-oxoglutarate oxidoreductase [Desulfobacterales bacterium]
MEAVFKRPESLTDIPTHFCPGCHHGIIHRLVAECIDEFGIREKIIGVASVGCSVFLYDYFLIDVLEAPHGRAPAVATGVKRANPNAFVFTYQGDGDLAAIGTSEIIHAANRGEKLTVIFVNNTVFGMTGGQMAPTTLPDQETTTTPYGRDVETAGFPIRMAEIMERLDGTKFVARTAVNTPKNIIKSKKILRRAFEVQLNNEGFAFVEFLSSCPTNWKMNAQKANQRIQDVMIPYFPLNIFKGALN